MYYKSRIDNSMLRKTLAIVLVLLTAVLSVPIFIFYGLGKTYFNSDFYTGDVAKVSYEYLLNSTSNRIYNDNSLIKANFRENEFKQVLKTSYTQNLFDGVIKDFASQILAIVKGQNTSLTIDLTVYRESLITAMNTLAYRIYQKLPTCSAHEMSNIKFGTDIPTCVPPKIDYDIVVNPIIENFQSEIYQKIPAKISNINQQLPINVIQDFFIIKNILFLMLIIFLSLIALLMWRPFSGLVFWEGIVFLSSGIVGLILSFVNLSMIDIQTSLSPDVINFINQLLGFLTDEIRQMSLIFLIIGVSLIIVKMVIKRTIENERICLK